MTIYILGGCLQLCVFCVLYPTTRAGVFVALDFLVDDRLSTGSMDVYNCERFLLSFYRAGIGRTDVFLALYYLVNEELSTCSADVYNCYNIRSQGRGRVYKRFCGPGLHSR